MGTDNKEMAWILLDENTKPIRISFDDEPTYAVENDTNYAMNIQPPATFSAICKMRGNSECKSGSPKTCKKISSTFPDNFCSTF